MIKYYQRIHKLDHSVIIPGEFELTMEGRSSTTQLCMLLNLHDSVLQMDADMADLRKSIETKIFKIIPQTA